MAKATLLRPGGLLSGVAAALVALCIALAAAAPGALAAGGDAAPIEATAVACRLAGEGFWGGGAVSSALSSAPKSLQARACDLSKGIRFRQPSECQRLYDGCNKSPTLRDAFAAGRQASGVVIVPAGHGPVDINALGGSGKLPAGVASSPNAADAVLHNGLHAGGALGGSGALPAGGAPSSNAADAVVRDGFHVIGAGLGQQESADRKAADAAARNAASGALAAAFTGLEKRDLSGATPEAVATACTLARSEDLLRSACRKSDACSSDWVYENTCLDIFRKGESKLPKPRTVEVDITDTMSQIWKDNHPGERAIRHEFVYTDCCDKISSTCRCDMRKRIIKEGNVPTVGCLNDTEELQSCKP